MVRFINGVPDIVYYSEHSSGAAYKFSAVEKVGDRPVSYIAFGTHANYAVRLRAHNHDVSLLLVTVQRRRAIISMIIRQLAIRQTKQTKDLRGMLLRISEVSGMFHRPMPSPLRPVPEQEGIMSLQRAPVGSISAVPGATRSGQSTGQDSTAWKASVLLTMVQLVRALKRTTRADTFRG